jgi:L-tyrosine C(3)-methyltransferase
MRSPFLLRHIAGTGEDLYRRLANNPMLQPVFYKYMRTWSKFSCPLLLSAFDFSSVRRVLDVGGGDGTIAVEIARAWPHIEIGILELPGNCEVTKTRIAEAGLSARIRVITGSMFEELPRGFDCMLFAHQLVIWPPEMSTNLLRAAYTALPPGGRVLIFSSISNDEEDGPVMAALDSVYFISIPARGGMIYAWKDYEKCLSAAGFEQWERHPFQGWTPHGLLVATKDS